MEQTTPALIYPSVFTDDAGIVAGFSTRHGGVSQAPYATLNLGLNTGDDPERVQENRRLLAATLGFTLDQIAVAGQVHGDRVLLVTEPGQSPGYDAMVTERPGILLCISAADCAAVLLADPEAGVVGACHAGWRGTVARISEKTVAAMVERGAAPARMRAYISPCISAAQFEVGPEVAAQFDPAFVHQRPGRARPYVDLKAALRAQLRQAGLPDASIEVSPHCTFSEADRFFSYRAGNGSTGRMMGFIGRRESAGLGTGGDGSTATK